MTMISLARKHISAHKPNAFCAFLSRIAICDGEELTLALLLAASYVRRLPLPMAGRYCGCELGWGREDDPVSADG